MTILIDKSWEHSGCGNSPILVQVPYNTQLMAQLAMLCVHHKVLTCIRFQVFYF
jgi:hypothetical protein